MPRRSASACRCARLCCILLRASENNGVSCFCSVVCRVSVSLFSVAGSGMIWTLPVVCPVVNAGSSSLRSEPDNAGSEAAMNGWLVVLAWAMYETEFSGTWYSDSTAITEYGKNSIIMMLSINAGLKFRRDLRRLFTADVPCAQNQARNSANGQIILLCAAQVKCRIKKLPTAGAAGSLCRTSGFALGTLDMHE